MAEGYCIRMDLNSPNKSRPPSWYVTPKFQLRTVHKLNASRKWGITDFPPEIPKNFVQRTPTEILLLAVYLPDKGDIGGVQHTFDEHINVIKEQSKKRSYVIKCFGIKSDPQHLKLAPGKEHRPGVRWVAFDFDSCKAPFKFPGSNKIICRKDDPEGLVSSELLSAMMIFDRWDPSIDDQISIGMHGYAYKDDDGCDGILSLKLGGLFKKKIKISNHMVW